MRRVLTIRPQCITKIEPHVDYHIKVLEGAVDILVGERYLRNAYETNRDIKYWSTYFLLKALTTSGEIKNWRSQRPLLFQFLQMNENTFYSHLRALKAKGLATVDRQFNIFLASYEKAAEVLDIVYSGLITLPYNPLKNAGNQIFQYFLRAEEIRLQKERQLSALNHNLDKNPLLRNDLVLLMIRQGADQNRLLKDRKYLQERLLMLQQQHFRQGSELLDYVFTFRADINRGVEAIKRGHRYRSRSSVSYMKRRMWKLKVIQLDKVAVESKERARIYVPDEAAPRGRRDGYKWINPKGKTVWFLTDQINISYEQISPAPIEVQKKRAA